MAESGSIRISTVENLLKFAFFVTVIILFAYVGYGYVQESIHNSIG